MTGEIKAIDILNYLFTPESSKRDWDDQEDIQEMLSRILKIPLGTKLPGRPGLTAEEFVAKMDEAGVEKVMLPAIKMYSYLYRKMVMDVSIDEVNEQVKKFPDRLLGIAGYDPWRIMESVADIEKSVKEYGFKGVYVHCQGFNLPYDDRKWYPLYETCARLGVPVSMQVGHSLERMPSEVGRPISLDLPALDFTQCTFIGSHTGWPWCEEMIAMASKHRNVYVDISAHMPRYLEASLVRFMDSRGRNKTLCGSNGLDLKICLEGLYSLKLKDETYQRVLRENAIELYKL